MQWFAGFHHGKECDIRMNLDEDFDAGEILRDLGGEKIPNTDEDSDGEPEDVREAKFGTLDDDNEKFNEIADDLMVHASNSLGFSRRNLSVLE